MASIDSVQFLTSPKSVLVTFTVAANETPYMIDLTDFSVGQSFAMNIDFANNEATLDYEWGESCHYRVDFTCTVDIRRMATAPAAVITAGNTATAAKTPRAARHG